MVGVIGLFSWSGRVVGMVTDVRVVFCSGSAGCSLVRMYGGWCMVLGKVRLVGAVYSQCPVCPFSSSHFLSQNVRHVSSRRDLSCLATRIEEILGGFIATSRDQN